MKHLSQRVAALSRVCGLCVIFASGSPAFATGGGVAALEKRVAALERQVKRSDGGKRCSSSRSHQAECEANDGVWAANHKSGSHNIVGGDRGAYSSVGGLVVGFDNVINGRYASVSAGRDNSASGGWFNRASGDYGSVSGGYSNEACGYFSSVSGGLGNGAIGDYGSVTGGVGNTATFGPLFGFGASSVSGGMGITASGEYTWAAGRLCQPSPEGSCQVNPVSSSAKLPTCRRSKNCVNGRPSSPDDNRC